MISWSWFALSRQAGGYIDFLCFYRFDLDNRLIFPSLIFILLRLFVFRIMFGYCQYVSTLPPEKLADIQWLALSLLQTHHVTVHQGMSFLGKASFCPSGHSQML